MPRVLKKFIEIKCIIDSREQKPPKIKLDKKFGADKVKICAVETKCFKALGCKTSTGDFGIEYRFEGETRWKKTKLSIELKRDSDIFSTLYSNGKRFNNELERANNYGLNFWILHNWTFDEIKNHIQMLQYKQIMGYRSQPYLTFLNRYLDLSKKYGLVCCTNNFEETIRRIVKNFIIEERLQYPKEK